jgi:hypothetical protein
MPFLHIECSSYCACPKHVMLGKTVRFQEINANPKNDLSWSLFKTSIKMISKYSRPTMCTHNNKWWYPLLLLVLISLLIIEISTWLNPTNERQWRLWPGKSSTGVKLPWQPAPTFFSLVLCFHPDFWNLGPIVSAWVRYGELNCIKLNRKVMKTQHQNPEFGH